MTKHEGPPSTPRWVIVFGIIVIVLVLLFVILKIIGIGGEHGPSRHFSLNGVGYDVSLVEQGSTES
ncbi:hypothetical protein ACJ2A9_17415 [Anaerobacillus sp. MEB173]|uniref:hypothetical protein n=1 Tax=Anaerobacillus sp. MEB173 TaxID=3383345 RepID=UPI003F92EE41